MRNGCLVACYDKQHSFLDVASSFRHLPNGKTRQGQAGGFFLSLNASREIGHLTIRPVTSPAVGLRGNRLSGGSGRCVLVRGWLRQAGEMKEQGQEERCHQVRCSLG